MAFQTFGYGFVSDCQAEVNSAGQSASGEHHRSPVDLAISPNEKWLVTANETSDTVSLVRLSDSRVVDEVNCGLHPAHVQFAPDGAQVIVTSSWSGTMHLFSIDEGRLREHGVVQLGFQPEGFAITRDGKKAYVGLVASAEIAVVDLERGEVTGKFSTGNWPRFVSLSSDDSRLAVGCSGDGKIAVLDTQSGATLFENKLTGGINFGHMLTSPDGRYAYFPWMVYRTNPISVRNIRLGWVLASRIGRVRLDESAYREAIALDVPRLAVADPHDLVITSDERRLVASASGTHELLVYRLPDMPFMAQGGPSDLIDPQLQYDSDRFDRIELGGRPMGMALAADDKTVCVANYLHNSVQVVDIEQHKIISEIDLESPSQKSLARAGMEIFYDGRRSLDQWYSCHTCHQDGGTNARAMDTMNDGSENTFKAVLPLTNVPRTGPWTWHGWQTDLVDSMHRSVTSTMQGKSPSENDKQALVAFLGTLQLPPNPFRDSAGNLSAQAERGRVLFHSERAGCADCHRGPRYTDGKVHDVGTGSESDQYEGYNTPSLLGTYRKVRWLHSGRAKSLDRVVRDLHSPEKVNGADQLSEAEAKDLIAFLQSL